MELSEKLRAFIQKNMKALEAIDFQDEDNIFELGFVDSGLLKMAQPIGRFAVRLEQLYAWHQWLTGKK